MSSISQKQLIKQLQKLSPQQIQMIKLLELPTVQLEERIKQEIEENPVLEETVDSVADSVTDENETIGDPALEEYFREDNIPTYKSYTNNYSRDANERPVYIFEGKTLHESLTDQINLRIIPDEVSHTAQYIIGCLDDDGYLRRDLQAISDDIAFSYGKEIPLEMLEKALGEVQKLDPAGIGARDLQECLTLQLERVADPSPSEELAAKIIRTYFTEFSKKHYDKLISRLGVTEAQFKEALEHIHKLSPKPGSAFNEGGNVVAESYIIPDFILDYQNGRFDLRMNSYNIPELKVNKRYAEIVQRMGGSMADKSEEDKDAIQYVKSKISSAKWFISAIQQRHDTLMNTMNAILAYQREYFTDGNESSLRPMILKDVADLTGLDVSTISRVVNSKYVQTPFGIIPLKKLFSEAIQTDSGEEVSSYEIKNIIEDCIEDEDKRKPFTDEELMNILNEKGYRIARRTVAKYREMMGIPVARLRKEF